MKLFRRKVNTYKILIIAIFLIAGILRVFLSFVNDDANDDHFAVITETINKGKLFLTSEDCIAHEGFQPKLFYVATVVLLKICPLDSRQSQIVLVQLINQTSNC